MDSESQFEIARRESEKKALKIFKKVFDPKKAERPGLSFFGSQAVHLDTGYGSDGEKQEQKKLFTDLTSLIVPAVASVLPANDRLVCSAARKSFVPTMDTFDASSYGLVTDPESGLTYHEVSVDTESIDPDPYYMAGIVGHDTACALIPVLEQQAAQQSRQLVGGGRQLADLITIAWLYPEKFTEGGPITNKDLAETVQAVQELVSRAGLDAVGDRVREYCDTTMAEQQRGFDELFADELPGVRANILRNTYVHLVPGFYEAPQCFASWNELLTQAGPQSP